MTWNIDAVSRGTGDFSFLMRHVLRQELACLQEVTPAAVEWLSQNLPAAYMMLTPQRYGGRAWPHPLLTWARILWFVGDAFMGLFLLTK